MDYYIFGYGSLINPTSISLTLGRKFTRDQLILVEINGYSRSWNLVVPVILISPNKLINAVFLDLQPCAGKAVNGVIFKTTMHEIEDMDTREKQYDRVDVTENIQTTKLMQDFCVFTYIGKKEFFARNFENPKILKRYYDVITEGLRYWGAEFIERFNHSTEPNHYEIIEGSYKFLDHRQNTLTGHE